MTRLIYLPDEDTVTVLEAAAAPEELAAAVNSGAWVPPEPCSSLLKDLENSARAFALRALVFGATVVVAPRADGGENLQPAGQRAPRLSQRQREVLQGLADGLTTAQIALCLGITPRTVAAHIGRLKQALGVVSRVQIVGVASVLGLLDDS